MYHSRPRRMSCCLANSAYTWARVTQTGRRGSTGGHLLAEVEGGLGALSVGTDGGRPQDQVVVEPGFGEGRPAGHAPQPLGVGLVLAEQRLEVSVAGQRHVLHDPM